MNLTLVHQRKQRPSLYLPPPIPRFPTLGKSDLYLWACFHTAHCHPSLLVQVLAVPLMLPLTLPPALFLIQILSSLLHSYDSVLIAAPMIQK